PKDEAELRDLLFTALDHETPFAVRFPRGPGAGARLDRPMARLPVGKAETLREGSDISLVGFGQSVLECEGAARILETEGISATVVNARFAKPLDRDLLTQLAREVGPMITAEENVRAGGFGEGVREVLGDAGLAASLVKTLAMPDTIVDHGPQAAMRAIHSLDAAGIAEQARLALGRPKPPDATPSPDARPALA
ncbi:MAG: transketolase C-terminal domain-containing protein, partial [Dehalococcoidia bacterium]